MNILPKWPLTDLDAEIYAAQKKGPVYIIFKEHDEVPAQMPVKVLLKAEKPGGRYPIFVTELQ